MALELEVQQLLLAVGLRHLPQVVLHMFVVASGNHCILDMQPWMEPEAATWKEPAARTEMEYNLAPRSASLSLLELSSVLQ